MDWQETLERAIPQPPPAHPDPAALLADGKKLVRRRRLAVIAGTAAAVAAVVGIGAVVDNESFTAETSQTAAARITVDGKEQYILVQEKESATRTKNVSWAFAYTLLPAPHAEDRGPVSLNEFAALVRRNNGPQGGRGHERARRGLHRVRRGQTAAPGAGGVRAVRRLAPGGRPGSDVAAEAVRLVAPGGGGVGGGVRPDDPGPRPHRPDPAAVVEAGAVGRPAGTARSRGPVEERSELFAALQELPEMQRKVVVLRHWLQLSVAETARELRISEGTVKSHSSRGLAALRTCLESGDASRT